MSPPGSRTIKLQNRMRIVLVGQQSQENQRVVEAAVGNKQAVLVEGIGLARVADAAQLQDPRELEFRSNAQREHADDLKTFVADRRGDEHRRHPGAQAAILVLQRHDAWERRRDASGSGKGSGQEGIIFGEVLSPDQVARRRRNDSLRLVGHEIANVVVRSHCRRERFIELRQQSGGRLFAGCVRGRRGFEQFVNHLPHVDAVGQRLRIRPLLAEPGFEHRGLDVEQRLQFGPQAVLHRGFNRVPHAPADGREQHHGDDRPDPDLAFEEQRGARNRAAHAGFSPGHVGRGVARATGRLAKAREEIHGCEIRSEAAGAESRTQSLSINRSWKLTPSITGQQRSVGEKAHFFTWPADWLFLRRTSTYRSSWSGSKWTSAVVSSLVRL